MRRNANVTLTSIHFYVYDALSFLNSIEDPSPEVKDSIRLLGVVLQKLRFYFDPKASV